MKQQRRPLTREEIDEQREALLRGELPHAKSSASPPPLRRR